MDMTDLAVSLVVAVYRRYMGVALFSSFLICDLGIDYQL